VLVCAPAGYGNLHAGQVVLILRSSMSAREFNGHDVFVIANHFDAKLGGDQSQDGRFQFPRRAPRCSGPARRRPSTSS
jgi:hypothetical protein